MRVGGMGIINPVTLSDSEHGNSKRATSILSAAIVHQQHDLPENLLDRTKSVKVKSGRSVG